MFGTDVFEGAAPYYAKHQPNYPKTVIELLCIHCALNETHRVLDLGCGTGQVGIPLSEYVKDVLCMDPDPDMIGEARQAARHREASNVSFAVGGAAQVGPALGCFRLVTMARSFQWMPREEALRNLNTVVTDGGSIAIIDKERMSGEPLGWWDEMWSFVRNWHGGHLPAGRGRIRPPLEVPHEVVLASSAFNKVERFSIPYSETWTVEGMVGCVLSTSRACPGVLGDRKSQFEMELANLLRRLAINDILIEEGTTEILLGCRS